MVSLVPSELLVSKVPRRDRTGRTRLKKGPREFVDPLTTINPSFWTQGSDYDPTAFDVVSVVNGYVTHSNPSTGPITDGSPAAHGCCYHDFSDLGSGWGDNIEVDFTCNFIRAYPSYSTNIMALEATPLIHVVTSEAKFGLGVWAHYDLFPGFAGVQSVWGIGWIGQSNLDFGEFNPGPRLLTDGEFLKWSSLWRPSPPSVMTIRSTGNKMTLKVDGQWIPNLTVDIPVELRGSTTHGFAIDYNHADLNLGQGGYRPPNLPGAMGPFKIRKI